MITPPSTPCGGDADRSAVALDGGRLPSESEGHHGEPTNPGPGDGYLAALSAENRNLRAQLATLPVIEQAKGILIARYQISAESAFALLRCWSSHTNCKLREISRLLVDAAGRSPEDPDPVGRPDARRADLEQLIDWLGNGGRTEQPTGSLTRGIADDSGQPSSPPSARSGPHPTA